MYLQNYLICYDITHPKRLQKMQRLISKHAFQLQYSVYYLTAYPEQMQTLVTQITCIIRTTQDDVRIYEVAPLEDAFIIGKRDDALMMFSGSGERIRW